MASRVAKYYVFVGCLALLTLCGIAAAGDAEGPREGEAPFKIKEARLDVTVKHDREDWVLKVVLHNTGDVPIIVDRDLVMGVAVTVDGPEGRIREESQDVSHRPTQEEARKRLTSLQPRQAVSRTIALKKGWRVLRGGEGVDGSGRTIGVTGYEQILRLPKDARPRAIHVTYGSTAYFWEAFLGYTGQSLREAGLYLGPLEQTVEIVNEPQRTPLQPANNALPAESLRGQLR